MANIKIGDLSNEITKALKTYTREVTEGMEDAKKDVSREAVKDLKRTSPVGRTGDYYKGWRAKKVHNAWVVHNKTDYQLTHLLEKGHVKRGGVGRVPGKPHIRPAEERANKEYVDRVEKVIRG